MRPRVFSSPSVFALCAVLTTSAGTVWAQQTAAEGVSIPGRYVHGEAPLEGRFLASEARQANLAAPSVAARLDAGPPEFSLGPLGEDSARMVGGEARHLSAPRVGRVRDLASDAVFKGAWTTLPDGRAVWRLALRSPDAAELRLHFVDFAVGDGAVWVYGDLNEDRPQRYSGSGLYGDGDFWTATAASDRIVVEYMAADGLRKDAVPFRLAGVGHMWEATATLVTESVATAPQGAGSLGLAARASASGGATSVFGSAGNSRQIAGCHLDVACYPEFKEVSTGVARILFVDGNAVYSCSGALVNTRSGVGTPLFLTADHCISTEAAARTVEAAFFYQSDSCGGPQRAVETVLGANYLISEGLTRGDYSLIRLLGLPKGPVTFLGLTTDEPALGTALTGVHHPAGSYKRISFGTRVEDETVAVQDVGQVSASPADRFYRVLQKEGRLEGGSSGSPLLNPRKQLIGVLSSGPVYSPNQAEDEVLLCLADDAVFQYGRVSKVWPILSPYIEDLRPAQMALPRSGDKFSASRVRFQWSPGVGVAEYRLLVGKTRGGAEYADVKLRELEAYVDNIPEDGSQVYARLLSRIEDKWQSADYAYLASSGGAARAARMISPAVDSVLSSARVEFKWDEGAGVSEYLLHVGSTPGGIEFFRRSLGKATSAVVTNLPGNGQPVFVRIHSRIAGGWVYTDAIYRAATTSAKTYVLKIANRLAYPVAIYVNERSVLSVRGGQSVEQSLPRNGDAVLVEWKLVRPSHPDSGIPMGVPIGDSFAPVTPADELSFEITNTIKSVSYFTPVVSNQSGQTFYVEVNSGQSGRGTAGAVQTGVQSLGLGYFPLTPQSNVRGYFGSYGYTGLSINFDKVADSAEPGSGAAKVELALPPQ